MIHLHWDNSIVHWIHSQLHSYILYIKEFDRKSFCQIWFCVAESFLITHLDPPESWKVGGDISYISSDNCHVIEKLSLLPSSFQRGNQFDLGWAVCFCLCPCVFMFVREIVFETDCVGEKVDSEILCYLKLQVAGTVRKILNLSWLGFSQQFFYQFRFASLQVLIAST